MTGYELYVFIVCFVTFVSIFTLLVAMLLIIVRQETRAIESGIIDKKIANEYMKGINKRSFLSGAMQKVILVITIIAIIFFAWTLSVKFSDPKVEGDIAVPRVVLSDSMETKRPSNTYLKENDLNDQFATFDLIFVRELPDEFDLELYDIVVYEQEDELIIHRIIDIEEPNEKHPEHRLFELRGDAVKYSDEFAVEYSQMKAIYKGEKIPFVGSFVYFMQSPMGYLCIILLILGFIATPIIERILWRKKVRRLTRIGYFCDD